VARRPAQENRLVRGDFLIAGEPIDLAAIECPVLNIFGAEDHIIPPPCSRALGAILARRDDGGREGGGREGGGWEGGGRDYQELEVPTGHVGVFVSRRAQAIVAPTIVQWLDRLG
jgi:polyhydroxyalkanoate synthase